jgi:hypothetical protein
MMIALINFKVKHIIVAVSYRDRRTRDVIAGSSPESVGLSGDIVSSHRGITLWHRGMGELEFVQSWKVAHGPRV